jgi:hypothetical protein
MYVSFMLNQLKIALVVEKYGKMEEEKLVDRGK